MQTKQIKAARKAVNKILKKEAAASDRNNFSRRIDEWFNFLKDDNDFDYDYILRTFKYKLERTRKRILDDDVILNAKGVAKEIKEVEDLIQKVINNEYEDKYMKSIEKRFGQIRTTFGAKDKHGNTEFIIRRTKETPKNTDLIHKLTREAYEKAFNERKADLQKAFNIMVDKIWGWWD